MEGQTAEWWLGRMKHIATAFNATGNCLLTSYSIYNKLHIAYEWWKITKWSLVVVDLWWLCYLCDE